MLVHVPTGCAGPAAIRTAVRRSAPGTPTRRPGGVS